VNVEVSSVLLLTNRDIHEVLDMGDCLDGIEEMAHELAAGDSVGLGRTDVYTPSDGGPAPFHRWAVMTGTSRRRGYLCARMLSDMVSWPTVNGKRREEKFAREPGTYCGLLFLYSTHNGEPLAILHDGALQHYRVGAGAGIGTKYLARTDSEVVGMLGSGGMARSYLEAFVRVRPIRHVRVFSPDPAHRNAYASEMADRHGIEVTAVETAEEAVRGTDIVALCVSAVEPVFWADWLEPGMHVVDVTRPCTPPDFVRSVDVAFWHGNTTPLVDPLPPTADYARGGFLSWIAGTPEETAEIPRVPPNADTFALPTLADLVSGRRPGRTSPQQTTFFHNIGSFGEGFAALAAGIYERSLDRGVGTEIPTSWFLEDIRD
jgi:ornithine cyclodeaminase/alanine dehydrogenase-like protein (mu-crystallin family)